MLLANLSGTDISGTDILSAVGAEVSASDLVGGVSSIADRLQDDRNTLMLVVTASGVLVVFVALIALIIVFSLYGSAVDKASGKTKKKAKSPAAYAPSAVKSVSPAPAPAPIAANGVSEEIVAVIAAAVASMDGGYVVRSVRRAQPKGRPAWGNAGIMENVRPF